MLTEAELQSVIRKINKILSKCKLPFHFTGGLASSFYGEPRFTQDIDIVIRISQGPELQNLLQELSEEFIIDTVFAEKAVEEGRIFQALEKENMIKIDFHVGEAIPQELDRSSLQEIFTDIIVPVVSKEDAILSKLIWIKKGSHKSRQDVQMMLKQNQQLDRNYLQASARRLGVLEILQELENQTTE